MNNRLLLMVAGTILATTPLSRAEEKAAPATPAPAAVKAAPAVGPVNQPFQPLIGDPSELQQRMQMQGEFDSLNRRIQARQLKLYDENATIKDLQAKMRDLQKKIDVILANDEELKALRAKYNAITPEMPLGFKREAPPGVRHNVEMRDLKDPAGAKGK